MNDTEQHFIANMLDGDAPQKGQMLSSEHVLGYIKEHYELKPAHPVPTPVDGDLSKYAIKAWVPTDGDLNGKQVVMDVVQLSVANAHLQAAVRSARIGELDKLMSSKILERAWIPELDKYYDERIRLLKKEASK